MPSTKVDVQPPGIGTALGVPFFLSVLPFYNGEGWLVGDALAGRGSWPVFSGGATASPWSVLWVVPLLALSISSSAIEALPSDPEGVTEPLSPPDLAGDFLVPAGLSSLSL